MDGVTTSYTYDNAGQILSESRSGYAASYSYDANGNRTGRTVNGVAETYTVDNADKLTSVTGSGGSKTYGYDAAGRTTSVVSGAGTTTLAYDFENRVTSVTLPGGGTNSYAYNGLDTRVTKVDSTGTKSFMRNGVDVVAPVLSDSAAVYTPGISERRSGTTTYTHTGFKDAETQSSTAQAVTATRQYDAFGNVVSSTGTWNGPFGYCGTVGYQDDADTGLKLLGHRYYDSSTGRFLSRDKAKDGRNWYSYCGNRPIMGLDPNGEAYMVFNGTTLTFWSDDGTGHPFPYQSFPAYSGRPGTTQADQGKPGVGPIPEGSYIVYPRTVRRFTTGVDLVLDQYFGKNEAFTSDNTDGWGNYRVGLHALAFKDIKCVRGGFFIHGGTYIGSAGCIDVGPKDHTVMTYIQGMNGGNPMILIVQYPATPVGPPKGDSSHPRGLPWRR